MKTQLTRIKLGLALVFLGLLFGIGLGFAFGANEAYVGTFVTQVNAARPAMHDAFSPANIWRYLQRAGFHAAGISALSFGLVLLVLASTLKRRLKALAVGLIGLGSLYSLGWLSELIFSPALERNAAHAHWMIELLTHLGTGSMLIGIVVMFANVYLGFFSAVSERG